MWDMFRWFATPWAMPKTVKEQEEEKTKGLECGTTCVDVRDWREE